MTNVASIATSNRLRQEFTYDHQGRRVEKVVKRWDGSAFGNATTTRFVYDGWNLLAILDSSPTLGRFVNRDRVYRVLRLAQAFLAELAEELEITQPTGREMIL